MGRKRYPKINDAMLAEALRQLLPVAELGLRSVKTSDLLGPFRRAERVLGLWEEQKPGRAAKLDGPLPRTPSFPEGYFIVVDDEYYGGSVPPECERPSRRKKSQAASLKPD
jgi:hypothetical protein